MREPTMRLTSLILCLVTIPFWQLGSDRAISAEHVDRADVGSVVHVRLENQPITPVTVRFIRRALREARQSHAECLVIEMDTPGGLLDSTRSIVIDILSSEVPVVVYVSPAGGRAASAGLFITLASHIAAMAPGTHIGAAHPVQLPALPVGPQSPPKPADSDQDDKGEKSESIMDQKAVSDTKAWARSLAELRNRDAEWAVLAVTESQAIIATEALEKGVIDLIAKDLDDLLVQIDGRQVEMPQGSVRLGTAGAEIRTVEMWWGEALLLAISNPNVAFLLLVLGFYGILFEIYSPGWGVGGTLGVICLLLGFFALSVLPTNYAGLALITLGLALFVAEAYVSSFGVLTLGGIVCLILGGLMLVDSPSGFMKVSWSVILPVAIATASITVFLVSRIAQAHLAPVQTGGESLCGQRVTATESFAGASGEYHGTIIVHGEYWQAVSPMPVLAGEPVEIADLRGLTLAVHPVDTTEETVARGIENMDEHQRC